MVRFTPFRKEKLLIFGALGPSRPKADPGQVRQGLLRYARSFSSRFWHTLGVALNFYAYPHIIALFTYDFVYFRALLRYLRTFSHISAHYRVIYARFRTFSDVIALFTRVFAARAGQKTQK